VLLIHGIGEQRPMDTLRGFVDAFLEQGTYHSKPDTLSDSYELRRLKLRKVVPKNLDEKGVNPDWPETDFYEYYWAHQMYGTTLSHVGRWLWRVMWIGLRDRASCPPEYNPRLKWLVPLVWLAALAAAVLALGIGFSSNLGLPLSRQSRVALALVVTIWGLVRFSLLRVVVDVVGDAARYFDVNPTNVARRYDILRGGIAVLGKLHNEREEIADEVVYRYGRVVIVGHSLGSVIAYDILRHYWQLVNGSIPMRAPDFYAVESFIGGNDAPFEDATAYCDAALFRQHQRTLCRAVTSRRPAATLLPKPPEDDTLQEKRWLVSDLVTLGSPLAYAPVLMADGVDDLKRKKQLRELPICPPDRSRNLSPGHFIVKLSAEIDPIPGHDIDILHHGAHFALTRWTNLYFDNDLIGGPLVPVFGAGIEDIKLDGPVRGPLHAHTGYWRKQDPPTCSVQRLTGILKDTSP
jgi:pimeloyl-ACP methyl ester carboxylesterase